MLIVWLVLHICLPLILACILNIIHTKIVKGNLVSVSEDVLTVNTGSNQFDIEIDDKSKVISKYYSKIDPSDLKSGDLISIWGKWIDEAKTAIRAKLIRDLSKEIRKGVVNGIISNITSSSVIVTKANGKQFTVSFDDQTKIMNRKGELLQYTDLKNNDHVAVTGLVDHTNLTVTNTSKVRDLDLPQK